MALPVPHDRPLSPVMNYDPIYFQQVGNMVRVSDTMQPHLPSIAAQVMTEAANHAARNCIGLFCYNLLSVNQFSNEHFKEVLELVVGYAEYTYIRIGRSTLEVSIADSIKMILSLYRSTLVFRYPELKSGLDHRVVEAASQNAPKFVEIKNLVTQMYPQYNPNVQMQQPQAFPQPPMYQPQPYPQPNMPMPQPQQYAQPMQGQYQPQYQQPMFQPQPMQGYAQPGMPMQPPPQFQQPVNRNVSFQPFQSGGGMPAPTPQQFDHEANGIKQSRFVKHKPMDESMFAPQTVVQPAMSTQAFIDMSEVLKPEPVQDVEPIIPVIPLVEFMNRDKHTLPYLNYEIRYKRQLRDFPDQIKDMAEANINDTDTSNFYLHKSTFCRDNVASFLDRCNLEGLQKRYQNKESVLVNRYIGIIATPFYGGEELKLMSEALTRCKGLPEVIELLQDCLQLITAAKDLKLVHYETIAFATFVNNWFTKEVNHFLKYSLDTTWVIDSFANDWEEMKNLFAEKTPHFQMALEAFGVGMIANMHKVFQTTDIFENIKIMNDIEEDITIGSLPYFVTNTQLHLTDVELGVNLKRGESKHITFNQTPILNSLAMSLKAINVQLEVKPLHNYLTTLDNVCYEIVPNAFNPESYFLVKA